MSATEAMSWWLDWVGTGRVKEMSHINKCICRVYRNKYGSVKKKSSSSVSHAGLFAMLNLSNKASGVYRIEPHTHKHSIHTYSHISPKTRLCELSPSVCEHVYTCCESTLDKHQDSYLPNIPEKCENNERKRSDATIKRIMRRWVLQQASGRQVVSRRCQTDNNAYKSEDAMLSQCMLHLLLLEIPIIIWNCLPCKHIVVWTFIVDFCFWTRNTRAQTYTARERKSIKSVM